jgi:hypothetical protein
MKPVINIHKLTTLILDGEDSYEDGRHSFDYELLTRTLRELGIEIDKDAAYEEGLRRGKIRAARFHARKTSPGTLYTFTFEGDWDFHFELAMSRNNELPWSVREAHTHVYVELPCGPNRWTYEAHTRADAAKVLGYIRAVHPDAKDLRLSIK